MTYKNYKGLKVYQLAFKLALEVHKMSIKLPKYEMYEDGSQIRRSSKSVKSNIVEGFGRRRYKQEFIRFLTYAQASCDETRDHLDILYETQSLKDGELYRYFCNEYERLGRMIGALIKSIEKGHRT